MYGIISTPVDGLCDFLQQRNVLRAVDIRFFDLHHDPPFRLSSAQHAKLLADFLREVWPASYGIVLEGLRGAVDMQTHRALKKIGKEHADVRVLGYITETGKDAIAAVFRIDQ